MLPIRDENRTHHVPIVNYVLIALNVIVFIFELTAGANLDATINQIALIPAQVTAGLDVGDIRAIFVSMFLHAGWSHLLGNMLYLWIFGDNVEDRLGHFGYLVFYLAGGVVAAFAHVALNPNSVIPTVGASGAIAAVLGAISCSSARQGAYFCPNWLFLAADTPAGFAAIGLLVRAPAFQWRAHYRFERYGWHRLLGTYRWLCVWHVGRLDL